MKKLLLGVTTAFALILGMGMSAMPASAQSFDFVSEGSGDVAWEFDFEESEKFTNTTGASFTFNGGAGTNGDANATGDYAFTGGVSGQYAGGTGSAYDDTVNGPYAQASFESGSFSASGALALDSAYDDTSTVEFDGLATAGGAGSVGVGTSEGWVYNYHQDGSGSFDYNVDVSAN